ncbi:MAG: polysaccharide biosynthesis tyrosine autokinase [Chloroflexota bacterium]
MENTRVSELETLELSDPKRLFDLVRRRFWLLVLGLGLGLGAGALFSYFQQPVYEASTRVLVTRPTQDTPADIASAISLQQTAETYVQFLTMEAVLNMVSERVGYEIDPEKDLIDASLVPNTQIINLAIRDTDRQRAALIAETLVQVLIEQNEVLQAGRYAESEASLTAQIAEMEKQLNSLQDQLEQANAEALKSQLDEIQARMDATEQELLALENETEESGERTLRIEQLQSLLLSYQGAYTTLIVTGKVREDNEQVTRLEKSYNLYQQLYLNLLGNLESVRMARMQNTPNVVQVSPALVAEDPIRPRPLLNTTLGGAAFLIIAIGLMFLLEFLDDTVKTPEDIENKLGLSVLGYISEVPAAGRKQGDLSVADQPRSPVAEAFRSLRSNLEFSGISHPLNVLLVTSAGPGEGKSTVAFNLAGIIAQTGKRVTLVDADLRRPTLHSFFDLTNRVGLTDVFRGRLKLGEVTHSLDEGRSVSIVTTGSLPPNPTELLASDKMDKVLAALKKSGDVVVLDSPPAIVADAQVLSAKVDGVLLVVRPGHTREDELRATVEQLKRAGANVVGVVFNRIPQNRSSYYGGYKHYSPYHYRNYQAQPALEAEPESAPTGES